MKRLNALASLMGRRLSEWLFAASHRPVQLSAFSGGSAACTVRPLTVQLGLQVQAACEQKGRVFLQRKGECVFFIPKLPTSVIKEGYGYKEQ